MLQTIREHTQGWVAGTIIAILIVMFTLWGIHSYFVGGNNRQIVATVNGVEITKDQLATAYERLRRQVQAQYGIAVTNQQELTLKHQALQALISVSVLKQTSLKQGFRITNEQIDRYLENMPEFQIDGQFSMDRFQEVIAGTAMSIAEFLELVRTSLLIDQPRLGILLSSFALPDETDHTIALVHEERSLNYLTIPLTDFLAQSITISPEQIKAYYDSHQEDFMTPEQVNIAYVHLSVDELKQAVHPTEAMLRHFYNDNVNTYTNPTRWQLTVLLLPVASLEAEEEKTVQAHAEQFVQRLRTGEKLPAHLASFHPLSKGGWLTLNQVPAALEQTVAQMTAKNQISDPIRTKEGWVIVRVTDYEAPKIQLFETVKEKVKTAYVRQHAEEQFAEMRDQLADVTYEHPDSLSFAAKTLHLPILTSDLFMQDKPGKGIAQYKKVREVAFSHDVLNLQNNSDVIQLNPETVMVLRVKSHIPSTLLPLKEVTKQIHEKLAAMDAEKRTTQLAQSLLQQLQQGASPTSIATAHHLTWTQAGWLGRYATRVDPAILDSAFRLPNPIAAQKAVVYGSARLPHGYAIIALHAVREGALTNKKQNNVFREQVEDSEGALEYELYRQSQLKNAKIIIKT